MYPTTCVGPGGILFIAADSLPLVASGLTFLAVLVVGVSIGMKVLRASAAAGPVAAAVAPPLPAVPHCPVCNVVKDGTNFCSNCGYDFSSFGPKAPAYLMSSWTAAGTGAPPVEPFVPKRGGRGGRNSFWPKIYDVQSARKAAKQGMGACFFVAGVTALVAFYSRMGFQLFPDINASAFLDAGVFAILGIGIYRMSRVAAVAALVLYLIEQVWVMSKVHTIIGFPFPMILIMVVCFAAGIRGTFAFHRYARLG